jgi:hypothetical protein
MSTGGRIAAAVLGTALFLVQGLATQDPYAPLQRLYTERKYFELRDLLKEYPESDSPELLFYRGAVSNIFNKLPASIKHLEEYLKKAGGTESGRWTRETYRLLADNYRKSYQYGKAADNFEKILILFRDELNGKEHLDIQNEFRLWHALRDIPPQTKRIAGASTIRMDGSHIPLRINGKDIALGYDTGADLSVLISSQAREFKLRMVDVPFLVGTITGRSIEARVGVADSVRIGEMTVYNAPFLVMADSHFYFQEYRLQLLGVIGSPLLAAMGEVTFTRDGELIVPEAPRDTSLRNLALEGFKPLIEGRYKGRRLTFVLDTGASRSDLWPPFLNSFEAEVKQHGSLRNELLRGAGSRREVRAYSLNGFEFQVSGRNVRFLRIPVFMEYTTETSRYFHGNLGQDLVRQFRSMTINFVSMSVSFNE